jgi:hypothetical protein
MGVRRRVMFRTLGCTCWAQRRMGWPPARTGLLGEFAGAQEDEAEDGESKKEEVAAGRIRGLIKPGAFAASRIFPRLGVIRLARFPGAGSRGRALGQNAKALGDVLKG